MLKIYLQINTRWSNSLTGNPIIGHLIEKYNLIKRDKDEVNDEEQEDYE